MSNSKLGKDELRTPENITGMAAEPTVSSLHQPATYVTQNLPVELLEKIFYALVFGVIDSHPNSINVDARSIENDRVSISQVCSWWRAIVLGDPRLWGLIFSPHTRDGLNWVRECLRRSGNVDLVVCISSRPGTPWSDTSRIVRSFMGTVEDDIHRVQRLFVLVSKGDYQGSQTDGFVQSIVESSIRPRQLVTERFIQEFALELHNQQALLFMSKVEDLEIIDRDIPRQTLFDILLLPQNLRRLNLHLSSSSIRHCRTGQAILPQINLPKLESLELNQCALPALSFISPKLSHLKVTFHKSRAEDYWWYTNNYPIKTPSHHEAIDSPHFPLLHSLSVNAETSEYDFIEPPAILIRSHPDVSSLYIAGFHGVEPLLGRAFGQEELGSPKPSPPRDHGAMSLAEGFWHRNDNFDFSSIVPPPALQLLTIDLRSETSWADRLCLAPTFLGLMHHLLTISSSSSSHQSHLCIQLLVNHAMAPSQIRYRSTEAIAMFGGNPKKCAEQLEALMETFPGSWKIEGRWCDRR